MATDLGIRHEAIRMIKDHFERVDHKILDKLCRDHDYEDGQGLATDYWSIHEMKHGWIDQRVGYIMVVLKMATTRYRSMSRK